MGGSIDDKVKDSNSIAEARKEISAAVSKQYENKAIELKKEPNYFENKKIGTDGANEHDYAQERGIKLDYNKLFDYLGPKSQNPGTEVSESKTSTIEERAGEMRNEEMEKSINRAMMTAVMGQTGDHIPPQEKERLDYKMIFEKVLAEFFRKNAAIRTDDININQYNFMN